MLNCVIVIRGEVDDEAEAHRLLSYVDVILAEHPDLKLRADCEVSQQIVNEP